MNNTELVKANNVMNGEINDELKNILEAVLLVSDSPVSIARMQGLFEEEVQPPTEEIKRAIEMLQQDCENRGVELRKIGSGYRYQSKVKYADWVRKLYATRPPRLSRALLETLAIIAYRQPVTRGDIEEIRGVSVSADIIQKLQEREWVKQIGVRDIPGRPALFGTTTEFLSYFNLESLKELPSLMEERELGTIARELETPLPPEVLAALEKKESDANHPALPIDEIADDESMSMDEKQEGVPGQEVVLEERSGDNLAAGAQGLHYTEGEDPHFESPNPDEHAKGEHEKEMLAHSVSKEDMDRDSGASNITELESDIAENDSTIRDETGTDNQKPEGMNAMNSSNQREEQR